MGRAVRRTFAVVLVAVAVLLAPVAAGATWLRAELIGTDRYVAWTSAVLDDPGVQTAVGDAVGDLVAERVLDRLGDVAATTDLGAVGQVVRVPVARLVQGYAREAATRVIASDAVGTVWSTANRTVHTELIALARDGDGTLVLDRDGDEATLLLPLAPLVTAVQDRLALDGLPDLGAVTPDDAAVVLLRGDGLAQAVDAVRLLDRVGLWAPWVVLALGLVGLVLVPGGARGGPGLDRTGSADGATGPGDAVAAAVPVVPTAGGRRERWRGLLGGRLRALRWTGVALAVWSAVCGLAIGAAAGRAPDLVADLAGDWGDLGSAVTTALLTAWGGGLTGLLTGAAVVGLVLAGAAWAALVGLRGSVRVAAAGAVTGTAG
jgi:hypothetical protein